MSERKILKGPAAMYQHKYSIRNINREFSQKLTLGQRVADAVARVVGSWNFIILQSIIILVWMSINLYLVFIAAIQPEKFRAWDPYPFILLNLVLSFQAAYTGPVVMMSQNRQAEKDRMIAEQDYETNVKAEEEIQILMKHLVHHDEILSEILHKLNNLQPAPDEGRGEEGTDPPAENKGTEMEKGV